MGLGTFLIFRFLSTWASSSPHLTSTSPESNTLDFGITVVEAQAAGTPVIAFAGGGFVESVVDGKTGLLIKDVDKKTIKSAVAKLLKRKWDRGLIQESVEKFSGRQFRQKFKKYVNTAMKSNQKK